MTMLGGGGNPEAWWEVAGARSAPRRRRRRDGRRRASRQGNAWLGLAVETAVSPPADAWHAPIETVSNSEAGFERVYQGSALLLSWPVSSRRAALDGAGRAPRHGRGRSAPRRRSARVKRFANRPRIRQPAACAPRADEGESEGCG